MNKKNGGPSLKCFTGTNTNGTPGTCTVDANNNVELDTTPSGSYAGVDITSTNDLAGETLSQLKALTFTYVETAGPDGTAATATGPTAGQMRFSVPTNLTIGTSSTQSFAFVYAQHCTANLNDSIQSPGPVSGTVDAINDATDGVWCKEMNGYSNPQYYAEWTDFTAAFPTATLTRPHGPSGYPYIVVDNSGPGGKWTLSGIDIH